MVKDLTTFHIQAFYRNLQEQGIRSREIAACKVDLQALIGNQRGAISAFSERAEVSRAIKNSGMWGSHMTVGARSLLETLP